METQLCHTCLGVMPICGHLPKGVEMLPTEDLERLLRLCRQAENPPTHTIIRLKGLLAPAWQDRVTRNTQYHPNYACE